MLYMPLLGWIAGCCGPHAGETVEKSGKKIWYIKDDETEPIQFLGPGAKFAGIYHSRWVKDDTPTEENIWISGCILHNHGLIIFRQIYERALKKGKDAWTTLIFAKKNVKDLRTLIETPPRILRDKLGVVGKVKQSKTPAQPTRIIRPKPNGAAAAAGPSMPVSNVWSKPAEHTQSAQQPVTSRLPSMPQNGTDPFDAFPFRMAWSGVRDYILKLEAKTKSIDPAKATQMEKFKLEATMRELQRYLSGPYVEQMVIMQRILQQAEDITADRIVYESSPPPTPDLRKKDQNTTPQGKSRTAFKKERIKATKTLQRFVRVQIALNVRARLEDERDSRLQEEARKKQAEMKKKEKFSNLVPDGMVAFGLPQRSKGRRHKTGESLADFLTKGKE